MKKGFTLAEVLITLGIIGIVAALTIPGLMYNHKKQVVESRLKKFYTTFTQAVIMSEKDNGEKEYWEDPDLSALTGSEDWYNRYLAKYLNTVSVERDTYDYVVWIKFSDGSAFGMRFSTAEIRTSFDIYFILMPKMLKIAVMRLTKLLVQDRNILLSISQKTDCNLTAVMAGAGQNF